MIAEILHESRLAGNARGDERFAHVADLYGCDRATWYRRSGYPMPPHDAAKLRKFDVGNAVEAQIVKRLEDAERRPRTGWTVSLRVGRDNELVVDADDLGGSPIAMDEVVGHPDVVMDEWIENGEETTRLRTLLEIKTTDTRKADFEVKPHYALQAAAYALAVDADMAIVHVTHVVPFEKPEAEYAFNPEAYRERVTQRVREVLVRTLPSAPLPLAEPAIESAAWVCKYCPFLEQCSLDGGPAR